MSIFRSHPNPELIPFPKKADIQQMRFMYSLGRNFCRMCATGFPWQVRVFNRHYEPARGGVMYASNHQSFLDPPIAAFALRRPVNFMARDSLFKKPHFAALIRSFNAFPVKRDKADTGAIKEAMRRLKKGSQVLIFPEGTRTKTGHIQPFLPGLAILSQRAAEWTVPVVIDGAFEAWPRHRKLPGMGQIRVIYGKPMHRSEIRKYSAQDFVCLLREKMIAMQTELRERYGRPALNYDDIE